MESRQQIILGIDPGTLVMGYGLICIEENRIVLLEMNVLKLPPRKDNYKRLSIIHQKVCEIIDKFQPHHCAIEAPFFGKNVQSMLKLGRAQGVAIAAAMQAGIPVTEYSPRKIKQCITGNGNADKEQVWKMLQRLASIEESPKYLDASDALAVAICHHFQISSPVLKAALSSNGSKKTKKSKSGWKEFIEANPDRIHLR
ncbi:MAG: crossover junction endodeoxyribonuclease RuvC [Bacteroidetes bacterium]|nr:MAG: crossover junction endodeoxyribonuclease RuvC [Bacteroidota bacterium]